MCERCSASGRVREAEEILIFSETLDAKENLKMPQYWGKKTKKKHSCLLYEPELLLLSCCTTDLSRQRLKILRLKGSKLHRHFPRLSFGDDFVYPFPHRPKMFPSFICLQHQQGGNSTGSFLKKEANTCSHFYFIFFTLLFCFGTINRSTFVWKALNRIHRRLRALCTVKEKTHPCCLPSTVVPFLTQTMYACLLRRAVRVNTGRKKKYYSKNQQIKWY